MENKRNNIGNSTKETRTKNNLKETIPIIICMLLLIMLCIIMIFFEINKYNYNKSQPASLTSQMSMQSDPEFRGGEYDK